MNLFIFGIIAPIIFVLAVIIGGMIQPRYSHMHQTISELMSLRVPYRRVMIAAFSIYAIAIILFGIGMLNFASVFVRIGASALILAGILGLVMSIFFPADKDFSKRTFSGKVHSMIATIIAFLTIVSIFFVAIGTASRSFKAYSLVSTALALFFWGLTARRYFARERHLGLLQRISIGLLLQWIFFLSVFGSQ